MSGRTDRRWRLIALTVVFTVLAGATALRLGQWQVVEAQSLRAKAERAMPRPAQEDTIRADILDRSGTELAQTTFRDRLVAYPDLLEADQVEAVLDSLSGRERRVLQLRFGLEDGRSRTLEEVGKEFNVTRERIRQIEAKALRKLRHPSRSRKLKDYLE